MQVTRAQLVQDASRHRHRWEPPATPPGFWDMGFMDSLVGAQCPAPRLLTCLFMSLLAASFHLTEAKCAMYLPFLAGSMRIYVECCLLDGAGQWRGCACPAVMQSKMQKRCTSTG